jgi:hypothetical protein
MPLVAFVFRPGGVQHDNVFNNWQDLVDAMKTVEGLKFSSSTIRS